MCKEMPVIPVNKAVDPKKNNWNKKMEGQRGGEAQWVADKRFQMNFMYICMYVVCAYLGMYRKRAKF
jgi:hypothetical protein